VGLSLGALRILFLVLAAIAMKGISYLLLFFISVLTLNACHSSPSYLILDKIVSKVRSIPNTEVCLNENDSTKGELVILLKKSGYDCCTLIAGDHALYEDSILVLSKKGKLSAEVLIYDIARKPRNLKVWDYPQAGDKREKVDERIYRQTIGFD
jgi:hypothetical protein